ncbi:MAG TPA: hypothetical protein VHY08_12260, partial [Bacillota bacterium]|nr:hypothetical protein [Bacillota bacterium]
PSVLHPAFPDKLLPNRRMNYHNIISRQMFGFSIPNLISVFSNITLLTGFVLLRLYFFKY